MAKGKFSTKSEMFEETIRAMFDTSKMTIYQLQKKTGVAVQYLEKVLTGTVPPDYKRMRDIWVALGGTEESLKEYCEKDAACLFTYWDVLRPKMPSTQHFGITLKNLAAERGLERRDLVLGLDTSSSYISLVESCKVVCSWQMLQRYAELLGMTEFELIEEFEKDADKIKAIDDFRNFIHLSRAETGYSVREASKACKMLENTYIQIENGNFLLTPSYILRLARGLTISAEEIYDKAKKADLLRAGTDFDPSAPLDTSKRMAGERSVRSFLSLLTSYNYISEGKKKAETHTVATLVYLALLNANGNEFRGETLFYLENMYKEGDLSREILNDHSTDAMSAGEIFEEYIQRYNYSYRQVEKLSGCPMSTIYGIVKKNKFNSVKTVSTIFPIMNLPASVGIEEVIRHKDRDDEKRDTIDLESVVTTAELAFVFNFEQTNIAPSTVSSIFTILFSNKSAADKYLALRGLPYERALD